MVLYPPMYKVRTYKRSPETRLKMRLAKLGKPPVRKDYTFSKETREKLRKGRLGKSPWNKGLKYNKEITKYHPFKDKHHTEESNQSNRLKHIGTVGYWAGKERPLETKLKLRESRSKRIMPFKDTKPERFLQSILSVNGIEYKKHKLFRMKESYNHRVDIFIEPNICIEVDGIYWHSRPDKIERDKIIDSFLLGNGFKVIRITDEQIYKNPLKCLSTIKSKI